MSLPPPRGPRAVISPLAILPLDRILRAGRRDLPLAGMARGPNRELADGHAAHIRGLEGAEEGEGPRLPRRPNARSAFACIFPCSLLQQVPLSRKGTTSASSIITSSSPLSLLFSFRRRPTCFLPRQEEERKKNLLEGDEEKIMREWGSRCPGLIPPSYRRPSPRHVARSCPPHASLVPHLHRTQEITVSAWMPIGQKP